MHLDGIVIYIYTVSEHVVHPIQMLSILCWIELASLYICPLAQQSLKADQNSIATSSTYRNEVVGSKGTCTTVSVLCPFMW